MYGKIPTHRSVNLRYLWLGGLLRTEALQSSTAPGIELGGLSSTCAGLSSKSSSQPRLNELESPTVRLSIFLTTKTASLSVFVVLQPLWLA